VHEELLIGPLHRAEQEHRTAGLVHAFHDVPEHSVELGDASTTVRLIAKKTLFEEIEVLLREVSFSCLRSVGVTG